MEKQYIFHETRWGCATSVAGLFVGSAVGGIAAQWMRHAGSSAMGTLLTFVGVVAVCQIPSFVVDYRHRNRRPSQKEKSPPPEVQ